MNTINYKYSDNITIKINETIYINDSLTITLKGFSHKRPDIGESVKVMAFLIPF